MITLLYNQTSRKYFFVDSTEKSIAVIAQGAFYALHQFKTYLQLEVITVPDLAHINTIRKAVQTGLLDNVEKTNIAATIRKTYPEYFI